jgi:lipoate-protein ligase B
LIKAEVPIEPTAETVPQVYDLGFVKDYKEVWDFQKDLVSKRIKGKIPDSVILVEHDHVITLGRASHLDNVMIRDLPMFEIERGGDVTYHGPGQLVGYPIISLQKRNLGVRQFVELIEAAIVEAVSEIGLKNAEGKLGQATGVWIDNKRKIASIGIAVSHWVTYHGLALNVNTDLSYFGKIRPCGFESTVMTSLAKELQVQSVDMDKVKLGFISSFSKGLNQTDCMSAAKTLLE